MTLALYGKTRRRQGGLILAGMLAVLAAVLFAVASMGGGRDAQGLTLGSANGTWNNAVAIGSGGCSPTGEGTSAINWGDSNGNSSGCGSSQSGYLWQGVTGPVVFNPGVDFPLGKFTHFNNPINGNSLAFASLGLNLAFTDPVQNVPITFLFNHDETPNQFPCTYAATNGPCDDRVTVTNPANPQFVIGENVYTLTITGFRGVPNNNNACPAVPPAGNVNSFVTAESATNRACIYAQLTFVAPVIDINKTAQNSTVTPPGAVVYDITVANNGGAPASNVTFTDPLPQGLTWQVMPPPPAGITCNINTAPTPDVLTCTIPSLAPSSVVSITLRSSATSDALCGPYVNTASITSPGHGTDSDSETVTVTCPPATRTIRVVKVTDSPLHPAADFAGIITSAIAPDDTWNQSLALNGADSGPGEVNTVSIAEHTVDETSIPANWTESGYFQTADVGGAVCSTDPASYIGSSALVPAGIGNVLVCVRNTFAAPTRTIRVVKVTDTASHPGGTFAGNVTPTAGSPLPWSEILGASEANSGNGDSFTVSTGQHTVSESTPPANWANTGYYQVADAGAGTTPCSTTAGDYNAGSATVLADTGNVLVCVRNTYTAPTRTIRVVKVTNTTTHPGADFGGTISDAVAPDNAWAQSLAANAANSGSGEINTVSAAAHTVDETTIPASWVESGYYQVADAGIGTTLCSTTPGDYTGSSIVVGAGTGNVLVCVRNTLLTRTIRVQKVTTSAGHPGGAFSGGVADGGINGDNQWNATLNAWPDINSAPGETFTTLQTQQTVFELTPPANWTLAGFNVSVDAGQQCTGNEIYSPPVSGDEVSVPANASNYLVCVLNTFTPPTRTVRIIKTTDTVDHPGGSFTGTILPGQTTPSADAAWDATLAPDAPSAAAGTFQTAHTQQMVNENPTPTNWVESGYAVIPDPTGVATCAGATYAFTASATVPADAANYVVCVRNRFTPPRPTVSKVAATPAFDATYAYYQIIINNSAANSIERDNIVITDSFSQAQITSVSGSGTCGGPVPLAGPWTCNDIAAGGTLTLNIRIPLDANPDGVTSCGVRQIDNTISSATMAGIPLTITGGGPGNPIRVEAPPTASAECITITKVNTGNGTWTVVFSNTGPEATVNMMDTYQPFVDGTDNINTVTYQAGGANVPGCTGFQTNLVQNCAPLIAGGDPFDPTLTTILVTTDPVSIQCGAEEVINTVSFTYNGSAPETSEDNFPFAGNNCAVPSVSKAPAVPQYDDEFAYFQIVIDNDFPNSAARNGIIVTDTIDEAELTGTSGSGSCTPASGPDPWSCDVAAGATLTLDIRVPITVAGTDACLDRTITNDVQAVVGPPDIVPTVSIPAEVVVPGTASADCLSLLKTNTENGTWTIEIHNTGPATTVFLSDTYVPFLDDIIESVAGCTATIPAGGLSFTCAASVPASNGTDEPEAVITVSTTALPVGTCAGGESSNTVTGFFVSSTGEEIGTSTDTQPVPPDPGDCTVTLNLCKQWTTEPGEQVVGGTEDFTFTVGTTPITIFGVAEGGATECITLSVTISEFGDTGFLPITENGPLTGFVTPLVSINGSSPATSASVNLPLDQCQQVTSFAGQVFGLLRSISFLVTPEPPPPSTTPDCTVLFINDDTENDLPTGNIQIEKYRDNNGDGDANDAGEGVIPGWQMTTTCPNDPTNVSETDGSGVVFILGLDEGQSCTVTEELPANWQVTRVTVNGANMGASTSASVTVPGSGATAFVRFYNRELGGISAHKTTVNVVNGIETVNTDDDDGWTMTVKSAACGIDLALDTDANGNAVFSGLPMCTDYVVAEVPGSGAPGYTPVGPISVSPITPTVGGATQVNFTNETRSTTPPCPNCSGGTPTPSPTPPTATATPPTPTATPGTPTATPGTPTATPPNASATVPPPNATADGGANLTPSSTIAGDQTPAPPSTGESGSGDAPGGNALLILAGLGALASGIAFMAMGRKRRS